MKDEITKLPAPTKPRQEIITYNNGEIIEVKDIDSPLDPKQLFTAEHLTDCLQIARTIVDGYVEIKRIKEKTDSTIKEIQARTDQIEKIAVAEIGLLKEKTYTTQVKGQIVVSIIKSINEQINYIPEVDSNIMYMAISNIPRLVELALRD